MASSEGRNEKTPEQRLDEVEAALGMKAPAFRQRLDAVETKVEELSGADKPRTLLVFLDYGVKIVGALTPFVILAVGFMIKDSVDLAIKERELRIKEAHLKIDEAQALDSLVKEFRTADIGEEEAQAKALLILHYGNAGIRPLIEDLNAQAHQQVRADAAAQALKVHAVMGDERTSICQQLERVRDMKPPIFVETGLQRVTTLMRDLACEGLER